MIIKTEKVYRCEFCSGRKRKKSFRRHIIARHETICFDNPNRTPMPGELTQEWQAGRYVFDRETGANDFVPNDMPAWWPGVGKIYTGSKWLPVDGYKVEGLGFEEWPKFEGVELNKIRPWVRRLEVLGVEEEDMPEDVRRVVDEYRPEEWR